MKPWTIVALLVLGSLLPSCSPRSMLGRSGDLVVTGAIERGPYLDVVVQDDDIAIRVFADGSDPACRAVFTVGQPVDYSNRGLAGRFTAAAGRCDAIGIGDPFIRRVSQPQTGDRSVVPRGQATFERIHEDDSVALLRGRFPLVGRVGWSGGEDTVAVVQTSSVCRDVIDAGVASIEFRAHGSNTLALVGRNGLCRIDGLIQPR